MLRSSVAVATVCARAPIGRRGVAANGRWLQADSTLDVSGAQMWCVGDAVRDTLTVTHALGTLNNGTLTSQEGAPLFCGE